MSQLIPFLVLALFPGPDGPAKDGVDPELAFFADARRLQAATAGQVVVAQDPFLAAALRSTGKRYNFWSEPEYELDLDAYWLPFLVDGTKAPVDFRKRENAGEIRRSEWAYLRVLSDALV